MYVSEHKLICRNDRKDFIPHIVDGFQPLSVSTSVASINNNENNNNNDVREKLPLSSFLSLPPSFPPFAFASVFFVTPSFSHLQTIPAYRYMVGVWCIVCVCVITVLQQLCMKTADKRAGWWNVKQQHMTQLKDLW